ncbi:MAG: D-citramalate synthase [bacterium]|jgi:D-citramalate synthase
MKATKVEIMDTTLRDGEQTQGVSFFPLEKLNIAKSLLKNLNLDRIEIASARVSEGEKKGAKDIFVWAKAEGYLERIEILGFVDQTKSVDWICEAGGKAMNLLTKGSLKHCSQQLGKTLDEHIQGIKQTIEYADQKGLNVNVYLEDWSNGYADSREYVYEMMEKLQDTCIKRFMLPDTLGVMSPDEVFESLSDMTTRFPWAHFDFHPHNDYGLATANVMMAVKAGIRAVHTTVNCLGERAGNSSLVEVVVALKDKMGVELSVDERYLVSVSEMVANFSGKRVASNTPVIGGDVFTQTSGIHADGDKKGGLYKSNIQPERFGRTHSYALGKMSGKASLQKNLELMGLNLSKENEKKVLERIVKLGDSKNVITVEDLPFIITDVLESNEYNRVKMLNCSVTSGLNLQSIASICIEVDKKEYLATGSGNGGYDAVMTAIRSIFKDFGMVIPTLIDYEIRIPKTGRSSALTECLITWEYQEKRFRSIGVDSDQVIAAVNATLKMLNLKIDELI